jgi:hypothetical protein
MKHLKPIFAIAFMLAVLFIAHFACACMIGAKLCVLTLLPEGQLRSGKSGSVVWMRNGRMRVKVIPMLVQNAYTTGVRAILATLSGGWRNLSQANQNSWIAAAGFTATDRLGRVIQIVGKALYVRLNDNLTNIGVAIISIAPVPTAVATPTSAAAPVVAHAAATFTYAFSNANAALGAQYLATTQLSTGINRPKSSAFRKFAAAQASTVAPTAAALYTAYTAKFGNPPAGTTIWFKVNYLSNVTGQQGVSTQAYKILVAA